MYTSLPVEHLYLAFRFWQVPLSNLAACIRLGWPAAFARS